MKRRLFLAALSLAILAATMLAYFYTPVQVQFQTASGKTVHTISINGANVHLIQIGEQWIMVDAGSASDAEAFDAQIRSRGIDPNTIALLVLTHGHDDHAGSATYFQRKYETPVVAGAGDAVQLAAGETGEICPTGVIASLISASKPDKSYPAVQADVLVDKQLALSELGLEGTLLAVPGHTPGSIVLVVDNVAFVGDLIRGGLVDATAPAQHFFMCDIADNQTDIATFALRHGIDTWLPGHFGPLDIKAVRDYSRSAGD